MQVPYNTVKFRGMYKETRKFLLRCTKKEPFPEGLRPQARVGAQPP